MFNCDEKLKGSISAKQGIEGSISIPSGLGGVREEELVIVPVVDGVLQLTTDKYQTANFEGNTSVQLPNVNKFVELHLFFRNIDDIKLDFPNEIKWKSYPTVRKDKITRLILTFIRNEWVGELIDYSDQTKPVEEGLICWLDGRDGEEEDRVWKDRSGNGNDADILGSGHVWTGESLRFLTGSNTSIFEISKPILPDSTNFTLEVAVRINETDSDYKSIILANTSKAWGGSMFLCTYSNYLRLDPGSNDFVFENYNQKNVLTIVKSGDMRKFYINGEFIKETVYKLNEINYLGNWDRKVSKSDYYSVKLYNRALTNKEIQENYIYESFIKNTKSLLENRISNLERENATQDEVINTTMLATDELFSMLEPLLSDTYSLERSVSKMVEMYVAMIQRGIKTIDQVPIRYREKVKELLSQLED